MNNLLETRQHKIVALEKALKESKQEKTELQQQIELLELKVKPNQRAVHKVLTFFSSRSKLAPPRLVWKLNWPKWSRSEMPSKPRFSIFSWKSTATRKR